MGIRVVRPGVVPLVARVPVAAWVEAKVLLTAREEPQALVKARVVAADREAVLVAFRA